MSQFAQFIKRLIGSAVALAAALYFSQKQLAGDEFSILGMYLLFELAHYGYSHHAARQETGRRSSDRIEQRSLIKKRSI